MAQIKLTLEPANLVNLTDSKVAQLVSSLGDVYQAVPLALFKMAPEGSNWRYQMNTTDGRKWINIITLGSLVTNYACTFDKVDGLWFLAEFKPQRALRDTCVALVQISGLTNIQATW